MVFKFVIKHYRLIFFILVVCFFGFLLLFSQYSFFNKKELSEKKKQLLFEIDVNLKIQDSLKQRISSLMVDSTKIEEIGRKYYGYVKEGEMIYVPKKKNSGK
ncbi:MAG: FtsB family cell division protein [Candidatus Kapaibacteriales bacterium]